MSDGCIFNFSNPKWQYKGVFSAIIDNDAVDKEVNAPFPSPKNYIAAVIAFVWVDEKGEWFVKARIKFPSGNKQAISGNLGKYANELQCIDYISKMPMKEKHWFPNPKGTVEGLIEVMQENDLIESMEKIEIKK